MTPKEHKDLQEKLNDSRNTPKLVLVSVRDIVTEMKSRKFTAFEWFVLLVIVLLVIGIPLLAVIPE